MLARPIAQRLPAFIAASLATIALAGPLSPPQGPPRSTGVELRAIEPRVSINDLPGDEGAVHLITQPGHYVLSADVTGDFGKSCIRVDAPGNVTIDLRGYTVRGIQSGLHGIAVDAPSNTFSDITITNGSIADCQGAGILASNPDGRGGVWVVSRVNITNCATAIQTLGAQGRGGNYIFQGINVDRCGTGIAHLHAEGIIHRDIATRNCTQGPGIDIDSSLVADFTYDAQNVTTTNNAAEGIHIRCPDESCRLSLANINANNNAGDGLLVTAFPPVEIPDGRNHTYKIVRTSSFGGNTGSGVSVVCPDNSPIRCDYDRVACVGNAGDGISVAANTSPANHEGGVVTFTVCHLISNGGSGLRTNNPVYVESTTVGQNVLHGLSIEGPDPLMLMGTIVDTHVTRNGGDNGLLRRGRFMCVASQFSGGGGDGVDLEEGCLLLDRCSITRNTENGINVLGTLNATHTNTRRNGAAGVSVTGGSVVAEALVAEHNGSSSAAGGMTFVDCPSITLTRCVASDNFGPGFKASGSGNIGPIRWMAPESISQRNSGNGFDLADGTAVLIDCEAHANGGTGFLLRNTITRGRVERCNALENAAGFVIDASGCLVIDNRASADAIGGFAIGANNTATPVIGRQEVQSGQMGNHPNITQW